MKVSVRQSWCLGPRTLLGLNLASYVGTDCYGGHLTLRQDREQQHTCSRRPRLRSSDAAHVCGDISHSHPRFKNVGLHIHKDQMGLQSIAKMFEYKRSINSNSSCTFTLTSCTVTPCHITVPGVSRGWSTGLKPIFKLANIYCIFKYQF